MQGNLTIDKRHTTSALAIGVALLVAAPAGAAERGPAGQRYDDDTLIVGYRDGRDPGGRPSLLARAGVERRLEALRGVDAQVLRVNRDPARVARALEESPRVAYAEPNFLFQVQAPPNDPRFHRLWGLHNTGQTGGKPGADIRALRGWRRAGLTSYPAFGGVPVGIVDTGVSRDHPDLVSRVTGCAESRPRSTGDGPSFRPGVCPDATGHGTHVTGTLGAAANNALGVTGVAFNSPLIVCRAFGGRHQSGRLSDIVRCIDWLSKEQGTEVITMSFAGPRSETLQRSVKRAWRGGSAEGAVLVAAAGNNDGYHASYPAAYKQVISVAATNDRDRRAKFSNRHRSIDLAAPGVSILSTWKGAGYERLSGTSMSAPHVSGVAAQLRRLRPEARADRIRRILRRRADDLGPRGHDPRFGFGRVNLAKAVGR